MPSKSNRILDDGNKPHESDSQKKETETYAQ
jgi:hypothetical protein